MNVKVFFGRKNKIVGELDFALEIFAAAFRIELDFMRLREMDFVFVLMLKAMQTRLRRIAETARQMMVFGAIVELHVPSHRDEEHHESHQKRTGFQPMFFHGAKIQINPKRYAERIYLLRFHVCERPKTPALSNEPRTMSSSCLAL